MLLRPEFGPVSPEMSGVRPKERIKESPTISDGLPNEYCGMVVSRDRGSDQRLIRVIGGTNLLRRRLLGTLTTR